MVEAAGIEAKSLALLDLLYVGLMAPNTGPKASQPGQGQELASDADVEMGTAPLGQRVTSRTLQEHKISIKSEGDIEDSTETDSCLEEVNHAWPFLSHDLRRMIAAVVRAATASNHQKNNSEPF